MPRKSNTSYTVNKWNTPLFADINQNKKNLFAFGDSLKAFASKASNPKSVEGAAVGAAGSVVGGLAYNGLSGGLNSGAGSAVSGIGSTIGGAVSTVNPLLGGIISAGSGIVGGGINALMGTSVDQAKVDKANAGTNYYNSFDINADSFDDIQDIADMGSVENAYKGGLFKKSWARRHNEELKRNRENAISYAYRGRENNVFNLQDDQINNSLANFAAFGGYLEDNDMPVVDYDFTDRYLKSKERQMKDKNTNTVVPTINVFAGGGIEIKHPGRLTALKKRTGKTEAELWAEGKPEVRKMITFSRNARRWSKHALGGYLKGNVYDIPEEEINRLIAAGYEVEYL